MASRSTVCVEYEEGIHCYDLDGSRSSSVKGHGANRSPWLISGQSSVDSNIVFLAVFEIFDIIAILIGIIVTNSTSSLTDISVSAFHQKQ